jgi:hypothetical protein
MHLPKIMTKATLQAIRFAWWLAPLGAMLVSQVGCSSKVAQPGKVPLSCAISNLAQQAKLNYIVVPRASWASIAPTDRPIPEELTAYRSEGLTPEEALSGLLEEHKLKMLRDSATSVARIVPSSEPVESSSAGRVVTDTNAAVELIIMRDVPLAYAIWALGTNAHLNVVVDPELLLPRSGPERLKVASATVSVHWENLRPRQALTALLDSCDLCLVEEPATSSATVKVKTRESEINN